MKNTPIEQSQEYVYSDFVLFVVLLISPIDYGFSIEAIEIVYGRGIDNIRRLKPSRPFLR